MKKVLAAVALVTLMAGCAIHQTVRPVGVLDTKLVCIIESPKVREGFLDSYQSALSKKGYAVKVLPETASLVECPITSTYTAHWRWDLAMYLSYAEIKVYKNGAPVGSALYDSTHGGANMGKFVNAQNKIDELVSQLFPGGAGS